MIGVPFAEPDRFPTRTKALIHAHDVVTQARFLAHILWSIARTFARSHGRGTSAFALDNFLTTYPIINRRLFLGGTASVLGLAVAGCTTTDVAITPEIAAAAPVPHYPDDVLQMYRAMPEEQFAVPAVDLKRLDPAFYRAVVDYPTEEVPGTVIVDTPNRYLYHVQKGGMATRYGVGIGKAGFEWSGRAHIAYGREWPVWTPPADMIARQPSVAKWRRGQPPGIDNALGARALYIHQGNRDTLYRLHGTGEAHTIGKAISSGCVRLMHQDIIHLYQEVRWGSPIVVLV